MNDIQSIEKLAYQYFAGNIAPADEQVLFDFINSTPINQQQFRDWERRWMNAAQTDQAIDAVWKQFNRKRALRQIVESENQGRVIRFQAWRRIAAVASAVVITMVFTWFSTRWIEKLRQPHYVTVEAPYGEKSKITLAEGTVVWLNSGSKLTYADNYRRGDFRVELSGEGYFEAQKDKNRKLIVHTSYYDVEVTGTKFNITAYPNDRYITTTLYEGRVDVVCNANTSELKAGNSVTYDTLTGILSKQQTASRTANAWLNNAIIYENITLQELVDKLSRKYDIEIIIQSGTIATKTFNIALRNEETVAEVMTAIEKVLDVQITNIGSNYYIK